MILYFTDRHLNILGQASTRLPQGVIVINDLKTEDVETGVAIFECDILFNKNTQKKIQEWAEVGNYVLRSSDNENEFYNIVEAEIDTKKQKIYIYAEDDGLDLLNDVAGTFEAEQYQPISYYIEKYAAGAGWEIGINEVEGLTRKLSFSNEQTASARLLSIAEAFNNCEISFSFDIDGLQISKKYINIYEKRGKDTGVQLRLNKEIDSIITTKSIANLATALQCVGGTPENSEEPITLKGYEYDDGNFYVEGSVLKSRKALEKWARYLWRSDESQQSGGHIVKQYSFDTLSQAVLCKNAIANLKKFCDMEVNYDVDITKLPENVKIGDRVNIVDDNGELYLSSRVLTLETSDADQTRRAILGEHLIKNDGISTKVAELAAQFAITAQAIKKAASDAANAKEQASTAQNKAEEAESTAASAAAQAAAAKAAAEKLETAIENAEIAAETATQKATEAEQAANNALLELENSKEAMQEAQNAAESAVSKADSAKATAEAAETIAEAAKLDAAAAAADIEAWAENLETYKQTVTAEYTRKTELTEAKSTLQAQIEANANGLNLVHSQLTVIDETANNAAETAAEAQSQANAATAEATAAKTAADNAAAAAQAAQSEADTAREAAETAQSVADKAETDLATAQADLEEAKQNLLNVVLRVDATAEEIAEAKANVATAQTAADRAQENAEAAQATAEAANANATAAQTAANNAQQAAAAAQAAVDKAQADVDSLVIRVEHNESEIEKTNSSISSTVSKTIDELQIGGRNLVRDSAMNKDTDFWSFAGSICTYTFENGYCEIYRAEKTGSRAFNSQSSTYNPLLKPDNIAGGTFTLSAEIKLLDGYTITDRSSLFYRCNTTDLSTGFQELSLNLGLATTEWKKVYSNFTFGDYNFDGACQVCLALEDTANTGICIRNIKLERGSKATDWTLAPEEMATSAEHNEAKNRIEEAVSLINQLADSISMLVTDKDGATLMQQGADGGWSFSMGSILEALEEAKTDLSSLNGNFSDTKALVELLKKEVGNLGEFGEWIKIKTDENDQPCIELGEEDSDFRLLITNTAIKFLEGAHSPVNISDGTLNAEKAAIEEELQVGGFVLKKRVNGNVGWVWKGAVE